MGRRAADVHGLIHVPLIDWQIDGQVVADGRFLFQLGLNAPVGAGVALFFRRMTRKTTEQVMKKVGRLPSQHSMFDSKWSPCLSLDSDTVLSFNAGSRQDRLPPRCRQQGRGIQIGHARGGRAAAEAFKMRMFAEAHRNDIAAITLGEQARGRAVLSETRR
jgi:hypothetical protein